MSAPTTREFSQTIATLTACHICDQMLHLPDAADSQQIYCGRCGAKLTRHVKDHNIRALAFSLTALILLVCSLSYPMVGFSAKGKSINMTLLDTGLALLTNGEWVLGLLVLILIVILPFVLISLMLAINLGILMRWSARWVAKLAKVFFHAIHWNMIEVYVLGVLVSLTKIAALANIELGVAFWAINGFALSLVLAIQCVDRLTLWRQIKTLP